MAKPPTTESAKRRRKVAVAAVALHELHGQLKDVQYTLRQASVTARVLIQHLECLPDGVPKGAEVILVAARIEIGNGSLSLETLSKLCAAIPMQNFSELTNKTSIHAAHNTLRDARFMRGYRP